MESKYKKEKSKLWNITGDDFSLDDNEILEISNISLDEPDLEVVSFN